MRLVDDRIPAAADPIEITVDGEKIPAYAGESLAAALIAAGKLVLSETASGRPRGLFCGMGVCFDCLVTVDGQPNVRACMVQAEAGSVVTTRDSPRSFAGETSRDDIPQGAEVAPRDCEILIVGAGPAGLAAARAARKAGAEVVVVDESPAPGGQYYKQLARSHRFLAEHAVDRQYRQGREAIAETRGLGVEIVSGALVWGAFSDREIAVVAGGRHTVFKPRQTILATGAYERPCPMPGWTLPGVMTTGAAQILLRAYRMIPGRRILIAGNGPLNFQLAGEMAKAGGEVAMLVEAARPPSSRHLRQLAAAFWHGPDLMKDGLGYLARLWRNRVPVRYGHAVIAVNGDDRVKSAVVAPVASDGRTDPDRSLTVEADIVCLGYGFIPSTELARQLGCAHRFDERSGTMVLERSADGATSIPGVFVAGDAGGLGGARAAIEQGTLAGLAAAGNVGRVSSGRLSELSRIPLRRQRRHQRFQAALWAIFDAPPGPHPLGGEETVICRCEEVTLGAVNRAIQDGIASIPALKARTRLGMGRCQGRECLPSAARLLSEALGRPLAESSFPAPRSPIKPVRIFSLGVEKPDWGLFVSTRPPDTTTKSSDTNGTLDEDRQVSADVLVIGGGIVGCSLAYFLAREGGDVCLIEQGELSAQASSRNAGSLHVQLQSYQMKQSPERIRALEPRFRLVRAAMRLWQELATELETDIELRIHGGLLLADTDEEFAVLRRKVEIERAWGLEVELLSRDEIRRQFPYFSDRIVGGELCGDEGKVNSLIAGPAIGRAAEKAGARIYRNTRLVGLSRTQEGFTSSTNNGTFRSKRVINAAGPWAAWVASLLGVDLPVGGIGQHMNVTEPGPQICDLLVGAAGRHLTLKQAANGAFLIGGGWFAEIDGRTGRTLNLRSSIEGNLWIAHRLLPMLGRLHVLRTWAGISPLTGDNMPIIGEVPGMPGFYTCVTEAGFSVGPLCARLLVDEMMGRQPEFDLASYAIQRFSSPRLDQ